MASFTATKSLVCVSLLTVVPKACPMALRKPSAMAVFLSVPEPFTVTGISCAESVQLIRQAKEHNWKRIKIKGTRQRRWERD